MDPGGLKAKQLARALANRSAARLLAGQYVLAYADSVAALAVLGQPHQKASHRASEALAKLSVEQHVLLDTDLAEHLKRGDRGVGSVECGDFERAFDRANENYRKARGGGGGSCGALTDALEQYSNIIKALRGVFSLCTGAFVAAKAEDLMLRGSELGAKDALPLLENAALMAITAAVVLPSDKTFALVEKVRASLATVLRSRVK